MLFAIPTEPPSPPPGMTRCRENRHPDRAPESSPTTTTLRKDHSFSSCAWASRLAGPAGRSASPGTSSAKAAPSAGPGTRTRCHPGIPSGSRVPSTALEKVARRRSASPATPPRAFAVEVESPGGSGGRVDQAVGVTVMTSRM